MRKKEVWLIIARIICSLIFVALIFVKVFCPKVEVDAIMITLVVLALLPWIFGNIKSLEIFGNKAEFFTKEEIRASK